MELREFQQLMDDMYGSRDRERGTSATIAWLAEEVGELARAVRKEGYIDQLRELGDVLAWVTSLANQLDLSLERAVERFRDGCPRCGAMPCHC
jgi:NTP pyrophosphatase (non-canonical NTP hydrolase)